jgi:hypothetical protein
MTYRVKVGLPEEFREIRKKYPEIDFSQICRMAIVSYFEFYEQYHDQTIGCKWF